MSVVIRAATALQPGCRLYYDPPLGGDSWKAQEFFDKYRGKDATFTGYAEELVGVFDFQGRLPGLYIDPKGVTVRFAGESDECKNMNILHFIVVDIDPRHVQFVALAKDAERLGDLPHPILFYPGDTVRLVEKSDEAKPDYIRRVRQVYTKEPFITGNVPRYEVMDTPADIEECGGLIGSNKAGEDIELVARGNAWALYNDPAKLSFETDEAEIRFWSGDWICRYVTDATKVSFFGVPKSSFEDQFGLSLENAYQLFAAGHADIITQTYSNPQSGPRYTPKAVHACFMQHCERIRALTERKWAHQVKQSAA